MNTRDVLEEARDSLMYCRELRIRLKTYEAFATNSRKRDYDETAIELADKRRELNEEIAEMLRRADRAEQLIDQLRNARQKAVMKAVFISGLSIRQAAEKLECTERWAGQLIRTGISELEERRCAS